MLLATFDRYDFFQEDDFGGRLVLSSLFICEDQVVGENYPASDQERCTAANS